MFIKYFSIDTCRIQSKKTKKNVLNKVGNMSVSLSSSPTASLGSTGSALSISSNSSSGGLSDSDSDIESSPIITTKYEQTEDVENEVIEREMDNDEVANNEATDKVSQSVVDIIERLKKSSSQPIPVAIMRESSELLAQPAHLQQPHYRVTINSTREVAGANIISDAFLKLDFGIAIRDIRRFSYVTKLLHLLITQNLTTLSGRATKALFEMLEKIAEQGKKIKFT